MRYKNIPQGFTLIELLVVVLIIGILAAVAVPQYQKAVEKSRASTAFHTLKAVRDAQEVYYLANGTVDSTCTHLDVTFPEQDDNFIYHCSGSSIWAERTDHRYLISFRHRTSSFPYDIVCGTDYSEHIDFARQICQSLGADITKNDRGTNNPHWPISE